MNARHFAALAALAAGAIGSSAVSAQDAAETAVILSGTGAATGKAASSMGSAAGGAMGRAANAIAAVNRATNHSQYRTRSGVASTHVGYTVAGDVDPLKGTDAATYRLASGASISVSGGLRPSASSKCTKDCPAPGK